MAVSTLTKYRLKNLPPEVAAVRACGGPNGELPLELVRNFGFAPMAEVGATVPLAADELGKDQMYDIFIQHAEGWFNYIEAI